MITALTILAIILAFGCGYKTHQTILKMVLKDTPRGNIIKTLEETGYIKNEQEGDMA